MRIGFLNCDKLKQDFVERYGEYPQMFEKQFRALGDNFQFSSYQVQDGEYPADNDTIDLIVITGSKSSVYDPEPWIPTLIDFARKASERKVPMLGVCFGHQLLAHALGGKVEKAAVGWQAGVKTVKLLPAARTIGINVEHYSLISSHQDQVTQPAPGTEVLATHKDCSIAMTRFGDHIFTVQGHPEFEKTFAAELYEFRRERLGDELCNQALDSLSRLTDGKKVLEWSLDFLVSQWR